MRRPRWWNALAERLPGNFTILLCLLLAVILIPPFLETEQGARLIITLLLSGVVLQTLNLFAQSRNQFLVVLALAIPSLVGRWAVIFTQNRALLIFFSLAWILFLGLAVILILRLVLTARRVTYDSISGAICGYLLFGLMCSFIFALIEIFYPGSFGAGGAAANFYVGPKHIRQEIFQFIYFSLVTLASLGYGDIIPLSPPARAVAAIEGIAGQFYIAVLIARLVSLHSSRWGSE